MSVDRARGIRPNPPASRAEYARARRTARTLAREFANAGARAVMLSGSWARGEARRHSDLDLWAIGRQGSPSFEWSERFLVSVSRFTLANERRKMREPPHTGELLGAWRTAIPIYDPRGEARRFQREAAGFRWDAIAGRCDRWVARSIVGWGEEAVKIASALGRGERDTAAASRNLLAGSLVFVLAVHRRAEWATDNGLWERLGRDEGRAWRDAQRRALGLGHERLSESLRAAIELYALTADRVRSVLTPAQAATVAHVLDVVRDPVPRADAHAAPSGRPPASATRRSR